MPLHQIITIIFLLLIWHHSWHFEKHPGSGRLQAHMGPRMGTPRVVRVAMVWRKEGVVTGMVVWWVWWRLHVRVRGHMGVRSMGPMVRPWGATRRRWGQSRVGSP